MSGLQLNKYIFVCKAEKAKVIYEVIDDGGNHTKELLTNLCFCMCALFSVCWLGLVGDRIMWPSHGQ